MNKLEIQKRVLQNGKPLDLTKFEWDEKTRTFSSYEDNLVLDFLLIDGSTINAGSYSTINAGIYSTITAGGESTINAVGGSTINAGSYSTITAGEGSTINAVGDSTITARGSDIVIVNRNIFEVILPKLDDIIQICPYNISGHLVNGLKDGIPHIIADGILSKVVSQKGDIYKVINHGKTEKTYLIKSGDKYSHGETLKKAKDSLIYKLADRDTSKYEDLTLKSILTKDEAIVCYIAITGACASGTKYFVETQEKLKTKYSIKEIIEATKGQYGNDSFAKFFKS